MSARPSLAVPLLTLATVAVLIAGVVGVAVHHPSSSSSGDPVTPAGFRRLVDHPDGVSLAVPGSWQVASTADELSNEIARVEASDPPLAAVADQVLAALRKVEVGVFALDVASGTVFYTYGLADAGDRSIDQVSTAPLLAQLHALGATKIGATMVKLPLGPARQVTAQVSIGGVPVAEVVDLFLLNQRLVVLALGMRGSQPPTALVRQIQRSITAA